jgi:hypothetical protein
MNSSAQPQLGRYAITDLAGRTMYSDDELFARELTDANHVAGISVYVVDTAADSVVYEIVSCVECGSDVASTSATHESDAGWICNRHTPCYPHRCGT